MIECISFCVYNFFHESYSYSKHAVFVISLIFAIVYTIIMVVMWFIDFIVPLRDEGSLDNPNFKARWGFVYTGLRRDTLRKLF